MNAVFEGGSLKTPLFCAVEADSLPAVMDLLKCGADPTRPDRKGKTPLEIAKSDGVRDAIQQALNEHELLNATEKALGQRKAAALRLSHADHALPPLPAGAADSRAVGVCCTTPGPLK